MNKYKNIVVFGGRILDTRHCHCWDNIPELYLAEEILLRS